ncbi:Rne/Rng family ribonuclease [Gammaproteobacteria bacterium]|nr:Rne/Rng family ribonuclease [Gammaproteobacteria bacterium]
MHSIYINTAIPGEERIAIKQENKLAFLHVENARCPTTKGNIYLGKISSIEESLDAAFVSYGAEKHGFLPAKSINLSSVIPLNPESHQEKNPLKKIKVGDKILVQVEKEERHQKGAVLKSQLSLPGLYFVLMPNAPDSGGISKNIEDKYRAQAEKHFNQVTKPAYAGLIMRTAGKKASFKELEHDLKQLEQQWNEMAKVVDQQEPNTLIYEEQTGYRKILKDYLKNDIREIIIDSEKLYQSLKSYVEVIKPELAEKIKFYDNSVPLFTHFQIDAQIQSMYKRTLALPSGATIVIDTVEAGTFIDVNSARSTTHKDIEQTAVTTNIEAAQTIGQQMMLRDIGGIIVIDFIDMENPDNQTAVFQALQNALKHDSAKNQITPIGEFGLLTMSRQRKRLSLADKMQKPCTSCQGTGSVRSVESFSSDIIHLVEENAISGPLQIQLQLPLDIATFMINEKRKAIQAIELKHGTEVQLIPNPQLTGSNHRIKLIKDSGQKSSKSYQNVTLDDEGYGIPYTNKRRAKALIKPMAVKKREISLAEKLYQLFFLPFKKAKKPVKRNYHGNNQHRRRYQSNRPRNANHSNQNRGNRAAAQPNRRPTDK